MRGNEQPVATVRRVAQEQPLYRSMTRANLLLLADDYERLVRENAELRAALARKLNDQQA